MNNRITISEKNKPIYKTATKESIQISINLLVDSLDQKIAEINAMDELCEDLDLEKYGRFIEQKYELIDQIAYFRKQKEKCQNVIEDEEFEKYEWQE